MFKCPFCNFDLEPEDYTTREMCSHIVRTHEMVKLSDLLDFIHDHDTVFVVSCLEQELDQVKTEQWYNS